MIECVFELQILVCHFRIVENIANFQSSSIYGDRYFSFFKDILIKFNQKRRIKKLF